MKKYRGFLLPILLTLFCLPAPLAGQTGTVYKIPLQSGTVVLEKGSIETAGSRYVIVQFTRKLRRHVIDKLQDLGMNPLSFLYKGAWICAVEPGSLTQSVVKKIGIAAATPWRPQYKISPQLRQGCFQDWALAEEDRIKLIVTFFEDVAPAEMEQLLLHYDPSYEIYLTPNVWAIQIESGRIEALIHESIVKTIEQGPQPSQPLLDTSRALINVDPVQDVDLTPTPPVYYGFSGKGVNIAICERVYSSHLDFWEYDSAGNPIAPRFYNHDPSLNHTYTLGLRHGTYVAGVIGGNGWQSDKTSALGHLNLGTPYQWRGMAPECNFIMNDDGPSNYDLEDEYESYNIHASNHSVFREKGRYTIESRKVDRQIRLIYRRPQIWAAANQGRPDDGYPDRTEQGEDIGYFSIYAPAKNAIVVGSVTPEGLYYPQSSMGPTFDGRIKPDVMAEGFKVLTTWWPRYVVTSVSTTTDKDYAIITAEYGALPYTDRHYHITAMSAELSNGVLVQTAMDDKWNDEENYLTINTNRAAKIYVCYDTRGGSLPDWLDDGSWKRTGESIETSDTAASPMLVYSKAIYDGTVMLGGNHHGGDTGARSNYFLIVQPIDKETPAYWRRSDYYLEGEGAGGTSVAAPAVTGTVALMLQAFVEEHGIDLDVNPPLPSTIKAILIHTAVDLVLEEAPDWYPPNYDTQKKVVYYEGPDFSTGYGLVNAEAAINLIKDAAFAPLIQESEIEYKRHLYAFKLTSPQDEVTFTLAWDDVEGDPSLVPTEKRLVNDLDIVLVDPSGNRHYPWTMGLADLEDKIAKCRVESICTKRDNIKPDDIVAHRGPDDRNNVEQVQVDNPQMGTWQVIVYGGKVQDIIDGPQTYSLVSDVPLEFIGESFDTLTDGEPKGDFGDGYQTDEVTETGSWRWGEYFYGLQGINDITWMKDACDEKDHNYVIGLKAGATAEYLMTFGGNYDRLIVRGKADRPGPVEFEVYIDGELQTTASWDNDDNCSQDVEVLIEDIGFGIHAIAVKYINDDGEPGGGQDEDREFYLDGLFVPEPDGRVVNGLQVLYTFEHTYEQKKENTIQDRSKVPPSLNLVVENWDHVDWHPTGGLSVDSDAALIQSADAAAKITQACKQSGEITIEAWVRPHMTEQWDVGNIVGLMDADINFTLDHGYTLLSEDQTYWAHIATTEGLHSLNYPGEAIPYLTHVVMTLDGSGNSKLYIDGVEKDSQTISGGLSSWDESVHLHLAKHWQGELYLVAVYNRALTASEVERNFITDRPSVPPAESGRVVDRLAVLYKFKEGIGDTVHDVSGRGEPLNLKIENHKTATHWIPGGGLSIDKSTIVQSHGPADKIYQACRQSNEITIEAWVQPATTKQDGPARIATFSEDSKNRNFTLGQGRWGGQPTNLFDIRLRTTDTDLNGRPSLSSPAGSLTGELQHVVYTRHRSGMARIYVDGVEVKRSTVEGDLLNWDDNMVFALANEMTRDRPWHGKYYLVAVYSRALSHEEVSQNYGAMPPATPLKLRIISDGSWKSSDQFQKDWQFSSFDDSGWHNAYAPYPNPDQPTDWIPETDAVFIWDYAADAPKPPNGRTGPDEAWFRKTFYLPVGGWELESAIAMLAADDDFDLYVNGSLVNRDDNGVLQGAPYTINIKPYLYTGENVFAIHAKDSAGIYEWLLFDAIIKFPQKGPASIRSGWSWKSFDRFQAGWQAPGFDDSGWHSVKTPYPNPDAPTDWIPGTWAQFMWDYPDYYPEDANGRNGPFEAWFRTSFYNFAETALIKSATVTIAADDDFDFYVNGNLVFVDDNGVVWGAPYTLDIKPYLVVGENVFAVRAQDTAGLYEWVLLDAAFEYEKTGRVADGLLADYIFVMRQDDDIVPDVSSGYYGMDLKIVDKADDPTATEWLLGGGIRVDHDTLLKSVSEPSNLIYTIKSSNEISIEAWIKPKTTHQDGPARIVTLSNNPYERNFTLGQGLWGGKPKDLYNVRLRTTTTGDNGRLPSLSSPAGSLTTALTHVIYTYDSSGRARIYIDGEAVANRNIGGDLSNWDAEEEMFFGLANEMTEDRPWHGEYHRVAIYSKALNSQEIQQNFQAGPR